MNGQGVEAIVKNSRQAQVLTIPGGLVEIAVPQGDGSFVLEHPDQPEPEPKAVELHTLSGLVEYLRSKLDDLEPATIAIHVAAHDRVELITHLQGMFVQRMRYVVCSPEVPRFNFGSYYDQEMFVVALQALFADAGDRSAVLKVIGNIKEEAVKQTSDDGVSQSVTGRSGIVLGETLKVPNPVALTPYRTFLDVEQPPSSFVLRVQAGPKIALFEADGGAWKLKAIKSIVQYLQDAELGVSIIA